MARGKDVLDAIDHSVSLRSKSLLSVWMRENHDAFKARLDARFPDWKVLTDLFAEAGLTDRYGNKPKPESARKLWQRIKRETELERAQPQRAGRAPVRQAEKPVATVPAPRPTSSSRSELDRVLGDMRSKERKFPDVV